MIPNKVQVLFIYSDGTRFSGWREGKKTLALRDGKVVEVRFPDAWSAIGDGRGTGCEIFSLEEF